MAAAAATMPAAAAVAGRCGGGGAGGGRGERGKFLGQLLRAAMRAFRALPIAGTDEDFAVALALLAMIFVNRHGLIITGPAKNLKRRQPGMVSAMAADPSASLRLAGQPGPFSPNSEMNGERARPGRSFPRPRGKPGRTDKFQTAHAVSRAGCWTRGASSHTRGGCAPQLRNSDLIPTTPVRPPGRLPAIPKAPFCPRKPALAAPQAPSGAAGRAPAGLQTPVRPAGRALAVPQALPGATEPRLAVPQALSCATEPRLAVPQALSGAAEPRLAVPQASFRPLEINELARNGQKPAQIEGAWTCPRLDSTRPVAPQSQALASRGSQAQGLLPKLARASPRRLPQNHGDNFSRCGWWSRFQRTRAASLVSSKRNCSVGDSTWPSQNNTLARP